MTYCIVQINCLPLPRFFKEVTMKTAEERYEETWNSYLELLNKDPRASLVSFTKLKSVYYRGMTKWMSHNGLSVYDAKAKIRECHRKSLSGEPVSCNTSSWRRLRRRNGNAKPPSPRGGSLDLLLWMGALGLGVLGLGFYSSWLLPFSQ